MRLAFAPYLLDFKSPAQTSRGVLTQKPTVFIKLFDETNPEIYGIGEASVFPNLSPEANEALPYKFLQLAANIALGLPTDLSRHSSVQYGLEQAILDFSNGGKGIYFPSGFTEATKEITINGLIWMGSYEEMLHRIEEKINDGFKCIKLKIGALDREKEFSLLEGVRKRYSAEELILRVDANGAFSIHDAPQILEKLADLEVHSIEQPIPKGHIEEMAMLCRTSPVPIALDEELIGVADSESKIRLLNTIMPQYLILKPALCGGFSGAEEWIKLAEERGIGWWVTSALESNVGLNALAQWTAYINAEGPQGLGTGALFTNNTPSRLILESEFLRFNDKSERDKAFFDALDWRY